MSKYQPREFEGEIMELWEKEQVYRTEDGIRNNKSGNKMYTLSMFPYPSGAGLHVGHARIYTGTDVLARFMRLQGISVLHPMGWDAFGLPAENAAIKAKKNPMDMVPGNITTFKKQMKSLGLSYDWSREFSTTDPAYYRWTQWLFQQFFKMGLLYKKNTPIHFCPSCKTGLAEEEVLANGTHERCGKPITKKDLPQWIFRITTYAERLLSDLKGLDWPEGILTMQKNWIGKSEGVELDFKVDGLDETIRVFTTALDTIYGATFMVLSPEHPLISRLRGHISNVKTSGEKSKLTEVDEYIEKAEKKTDIERETENKDKTGVFTGLYCINPFNNGRIPIWIADYVLMGYGTGAVMGVPGHDARDYQYAIKYGLVVKPVIKPDTMAIRTDIKSDGFWNYEEIKAKYAEKSVLCNSDSYDGLSSLQAKEKMTVFVENQKIGKRKINYHLRDWIFSRQRYWGEPIPMVFCQSCKDKGISWWDTDEGKKFNKKHHNISKVDQNIQVEMQGWFPIVEKDLPLKLPYVQSYEPTDTGESPLSKMTDWKKTTCPHCGKHAIRETDTMPNWAGSCWYFLKFASPDKDSSTNIFDSSGVLPTSRDIPSRKNIVDSSEHPWRKEDIKKWLPVDWYLGGAEHAVLHLLYARFWVKALYDLGLLDFSEPFLRLRNVGMVLAEDHRKMSKSFNNVVNPDDVIGEYGADSLRVYEMFMAPFNMEIFWSTKALQGGYRFLNRIWQIYNSPDKINGRDDKNDKTDTTKIVVSLYKTIQKVGSDISQTKYNTAIAAMMEFLNEWEKQGESLPYQEAKKFLVILSPFAPFIAEKLWRDIYKETKSIALSTWPKIEKKDIVDDTVHIPVQVNGKVRGVVSVPHDIKQSDLEKLALEQEGIRKYIEGKSYKTIYVAGKILNFVLNR
ncbi:MAG: leucine--tRNA ligase [Patescibacteria group bacterium]